MITLALELSCDRCSLALFRDRNAVAQADWESSRRDQNRVFEELQRMLKEIGAEASQIESVIVGRGPGNYTGMRAALTLGESLLLPAGGTVQAVSSGAALAWRWLQNPSISTVAIVGDARRGRIWRGVFGRNQQSMSVVRPWGLSTPEELRHELPAGAIWISHEATAVAARMREAGIKPPSITQDYPRAADVAGLAWKRAGSGEPPAPATPIYLHPAV